ncbi:TetR/AcrR family transcriptional regulator [Streptomyces sp. MZ04]|uniref:TetR/AcrR family transcriptional regulator n=1 Tax=Streptomyces sp. MZ04 TaxID=2559236 RepID=UPI00107EDE65|nr:TetR/AcrR family transcriptional regulator [Streptomyces sp. MZ04]TGB06777.1 TetR family transcriptional regulator [Streptomyces sp. MZ04]
MHAHVTGSSGSLTERRKAETRLDIARTAAALFVENGLRATRAEDIARAAGVAPRTLYRYFATKEEAVAPLFAAGAQQWAEAVREAPAALPVRDALRHAAERALAADDTGAAESLEWVRSLLRMAGESAALRAVWSDACHGSEQTLVSVLAERAGRSGAPSLELRLAAALASAAVRVAVETWAAGDDPAGGPAGPAALAERCIEALGDFRRP